MLQSKSINTDENIGESSLAGYETAALDQLHQPHTHCKQILRLRFLTLNSLSFGLVFLYFTPCSHGG
jgi:hypothetical protein